MTHLSDDELVLHYYGEDGPRLVAAERHLRACAQCARTYEAIARSLNAVMPPDFVEVTDELPALRQLIRDRLHERSSSRGGSPSMLLGEAGAIALVWMAALVYPFSCRALFDSSRLAQEHVVGMPLAVLSLMWACAGPFVAVWVLNRMAIDRGDRQSTRLLVFGALMAAISPSLFLLVSRLNLGLSLNLGAWAWYGAITLGALVALVPWPNRSRSDVRFVYAHRASALVLTVFVLAHIINQAFAFVSLSSYTTMRNVMRVASEQPATYTLIVAAVLIQVVSGAAMGLAKVRPGAVVRNLQAVSGWYLTAFLLMHMFAGMLPSPPPTATAAAALNQFDLLATPRSAAQLPFLLLGVAAFLFHVGVYARLAALAYLAEASVRRLSYAGMFVGTTVVVTIGLALCGIHVIR